ncbi:MAG: alpha/beta fold hydrolase, partial [Burkholderiaceae bacterium]|nr:alpha/beta fold hydrolase [Burkholderiaceae bacterium]
GSGAWTHWIRNIEALALAGFTVLAPDMPGYGESDDVPLPHSARQIAALLAGSIESAGLPAEFALVGFSFGAVVAGHLCCTPALRPGRIVLVGAMGLGVAREREFDLRSWKRLGSVDETLAAHRHNLAVLMVHDERALDPLALYLQAVNTERTRFISRFASLGDALPGLLAARAGSVSGIWGRHDATAVDGAHWCERRLRELAPELRFDLVDDAGHWVQYERAEVFNRLLAAHLGAD